MRLLNILGSSVFQILSIVFVLSYLLGVLNLYFSDKNNYCIMTYMFEYPQFVVSNKLFSIGIYYYIHWQRFKSLIFLANDRSGE